MGYGGERGDGDSICTLWQTNRKISVCPDDTESVCIVQTTQRVSVVSRRHREYLQCPDDTESICSVQTTQRVSVHCGKRRGRIVCVQTTQKAGWVCLWLWARVQASEQQPCSTAPLVNASCVLPCCGGGQQCLAAYPVPSTP